MKGAAISEPVSSEQDRRIAEAFAREERGLRSFLRRFVADPSDAEDLLQDVFYELVAAYRLAKPIENLGAWLFRVARNRATDLFRKKKHEEPQGAEDSLEDLLPSADGSPEGLYARSVLFEVLDEALAELPEEQRHVFIAHELEGVSFKELAEQTGVSVNTLLSRKRYAVQHLRLRLRAVYDEFLR